MSQFYTIVIGLEVHVQLATASKLFCRCSTKFGAEPNTQTCPVCIGMPGTLPVMNRTAYDLALKTAVALNCTIPAFTKWDRKQYYYPDLPKGYQISQYDLPMSADGWLEISDGKNRFAPKRVGIIRAHLEEDAGKSVHDEIAGRADSEIDLNRTGTPLLEIVTQPDLRSSAEAKAFLLELKLLLTYLGVSDCNMQEGSLRVDANVNLHIEVEGRIAETPIVEIKNLNSFRAVERALDVEARRQFNWWEDTKRERHEWPKETRSWDDATGVTSRLRGKEESSDYRYFPDPDLTPVTTTSELVEAVRRDLGELPAALRRRLESSYGLSAYDADVLVNQGRLLVNYFLEVADATGDPKSATNWITQDVLRVLNQRGESINAFELSPEDLAKFITTLDRISIPISRAKEVFRQYIRVEVSDEAVSKVDVSDEVITSVDVSDELLPKGGVGNEATTKPAATENASRTIDISGTSSTVSKMIGELTLSRPSEDELIRLVQELLASNPKTVADIKAGKLQAAGALIGQAKKKNPNVDPNRVRELTIELAQQTGA